MRSGWRISVLLLVLIASAGAQAPATGTLQGHLKIISPATVEPADGSVPTVTPQTYLEYPLAILSSDGKQQIASVTADGQGNFSATLPPGSYILDLKNRKHARVKPVPFTITAHQTTRATIEMDTGVR